ncbi:zf-CCHC domain-containing protein/UBN2 domain-containing protein [Cephalotus follicularis]|uniref:Zf-CCHC domain-containing protein/UBN2 domain-containing protein n=1 Tax=Cephalotus follicularis TaxID=3775 RepID=A0A1Q3B3V4_CEPFO|nr:zf-CCHC domain-containing protein/UBN2 domain-containing protein [Cephalotus follicularis]
MTIFIQALDFNLWDIIIDGPELPHIISQEGIKTLKPRSSYTDDDRKKVQLNAKAKHVIICALNSNEFNRVLSCATAKEMWDRLEVTYEGTNQVKDAKINMLVREYEMFSMKENENISGMFVRFTNIINSLQSLNKCYTNSEMVRKILRCLPKSWMPKVTAIEEAKDLNTLPLEELLGSLMTHEMTIKNHEDDEEQYKRKKKVIAFKSSTTDSSEEDSDDEIALMTRRFKKYLAKKKFGNKHFKKTFPSKTETKKEEIICFECNKPGHYKSECPRLKKPKDTIKKKKAMLATWSDSDESSSDEEENQEVAQIALMAINDSDEDEDEDEDENEVSELLDLLEKFRLENASLKKTIKALNRENASLKHELECLSNKPLDDKTIYLKKENETLKIEIDSLKKTFSKFSNSSEKLDKLLGLQRCVFNKAGLGYDEMNNVKHFQKYLEKKDSRKTSSSIACTYWKNYGHTTQNCYHKRNDMHKRNLLLKNKVFKLRTIWVPKGTFFTNPPRPKATWVPKSST